LVSIETLASKTFSMFKTAHWASLAHICNSSYLGGRDCEKQDSRAVWANNLQNHVFKITRAKWAGSMAQAIQSPEFKSQTHQNK
jgi:hypothetical protein